ncbi:hypothetical protein [Nostoc sp.]|uniref:hypothetical protein n=1 Tax=Nostoc sp. TaxID=1180 RepID=UPI002D779BF7|nr:hypothetical protein [Nostoc sp.]
MHSKAKRLKEIPSKDVAGYTEAQKLLAIYEANLGQVKVRRQAESDAVEALEAAQREIESLLASIPTDVHDVQHNRVLSQLQSIINQLEKVPMAVGAYSYTLLLIYQIFREMILDHLYYVFSV